MGVKVREKVKGSKVYWLFIDHASKRRAKRVGDKKAAELAATQIRAKLAEGDISALSPAPALVPTFAEYAEQWLCSVAAVRCQASSVEQYRHRLTMRVLPHIGALPLSAITRERVKGLVADIVKLGNLKSEGRPSSPRTVQGAMQTVVAILSSAVEDGIIPSNPALRWGRVVRQDQQQVEEIEVFTPDELTRLLATTEAQYPDHYPFILCLARTGMRLGEAMALQWRDIDWTSRVILVRRSIRRGTTKVPKNGKSRRVDMSQQLAAVLQGWKSLQEANAVVDGTAMPESVFPSMLGSTAAADGFRQHVWAAILRAAELRYRKPHTLRHAFASILLETGEPITYVQRQLGHHSPAFTLEVYGHLVPRGDRRAVDRLDDATGRNLYATTSEHIPAVTHT
jgi:integrase